MESMSVLSRLLGTALILLASATPGYCQVKSCLGESCVTTADCENGLLCSNLKCVARIDSPRSCRKTADCLNGLRCVDQKCIARQVAGLWVDPKSGLTWQNPPVQNRYDFINKAKAYCSALELGGYSDWRLPSLSELRTLIRNCAANQSGGSCRLTDSCRSPRRCAVDCPSCVLVDGACYWPDEMQGECHKYWSSSLLEDSDRCAWSVHFNDGGVYYSCTPDDRLVRCVR